MSIVPLKVSPSEKAASAPATTGVWSEAHDRLREHHGDRACREKEEADLAQAERDRLPEACHVRPGGETREAREQHGGNGDGEHALRKHVDPEGGVDGARGEIRVDEPRREERVHDKVEVDEPDPKRHRKHQREHPLHRRVAQVEDGPDAPVPAAQPPDWRDGLDDRADKDPAGVHVELGLFALEPWDEEDERDDDGDVPENGHQRLDGELLVGVENPDDDPRETHEDDDREEDARERRRELLEVAEAEDAHDQRR
jgi:hypothetical protein